LSLAGTGEHFETAVDSRGSVQSEPDFPETAGSGHAAGVEKPHRASVFAAFAVLAASDGPQVSEKQK
jgi:hypothetical protein